MNNMNQDKKTVDEMINFIAKKSTLHQFLEINKIIDVDTIHDVKFYERDGNRRGLIVEVQEKNADVRSKIMVDLKQGEPIINQVYDALYGIGKDCSKRIIMYSGGQNDYDKNIPSADTGVVESAVSNLQDYLLGIYFFKMDEDTFIIEPPYGKFPWSQDEKLTIDKIPTREQFMADVFWVVYFASFNESFYYPWRIFSHEFIDTSDWAYIIYIDCSFSGEIKLYWNQEGVRYQVKQETDNDEYLKMVLDYEMPALQKRYGSESVDESASGFESVNDFKIHVHSIVNFCKIFQNILSCLDYCQII